MGNKKNVSFLRKGGGQKDYFRDEDEIVGISIS